MDKEWESLEHLFLNLMSSVNPSGLMKVQGTTEQEEAENF